MSTYASMTIAELRSLLTRNGVKVPQTSVKKAVLVNRQRFVHRVWSDGPECVRAHVSEGAGARGLATGVLSRQSAATDATKFERKQSSRGSAATRRGSRRRSSLASATNSEGTDLVDVARVFSSDDEELSEMSESPITSR
ncbi:hypothetical protein FOZ62_006135, partial [Perkinsus olseni]